MGSEIVDALVIQIGSLLQENSAFSNPIEQTRTDLTTRNTVEELPSVPAMRPIEQVGQLKTAKSGFNELSNPVEQRNQISFNGSDSGFIEQRSLATDDVFSKPVQQRGLDLDTDLIQQVSIQTETAASDRSRPIEQQARASNTINLSQFDFVDLIFPPCNSIKNPVDTNILWRVTDSGFEFDIETLIFRVEGIPVQNRTEFSVTAITNGIQIDYNPVEDFAFGTTIEIFFQISDNAAPPNNFFFRCKWDTLEDSVAPQFFNIQPPCSSSDVNVTANVEFDVVDLGDGVDEDSIRVSVEGIPVCSGLSFTPTTIVGSGTGFHVTFEHEDDPFRFDSNVTVTFEATDLSPNKNKANKICFFDTEVSDLPEFRNFDPEPCESFVDNRTGLTFEVYGGEDGIDISTLEVRVDQTLRTVVVRPRILRTE